MSQAAVLQQIIATVESGKSILIRTEPGLGVLHRLHESLSSPHGGHLLVGASVCDDFDWHALARIVRVPQTRVIVVHDLDAIHPSAVDLLKLIAGIKPVVGVTTPTGDRLFFETDIYWPAPTPEEWMVAMKEPEKR